VVMVPQDGFLFDTTVAANVRFAKPDLSDADLELAFAELGLADWIDGLPAGVDTPVGERGLKLSGGEKQRVAIARAILKDPAILIFDEATSALDSKSEKAIQAELKQIARNRTTLTIAHRLSTIVDADEIVVLDRGRIVERGTHVALLQADGVYARMWQLQQDEERDRPASPLPGDRPAAPIPDIPTDAQPASTAAAAATLRSNP